MPATAVLSLSTTRFGLPDPTDRHASKGSWGLVDNAEP